jgi:hypothetical protein
MAPSVDAPFSPPHDGAAAATSFDDHVHIQCFADAQFFASRLFMQCFGTDFPIPRENAGLPFATPSGDWRQYVAFYRWPDERLEAVGFCNWIRHDDVYLGGGMCVSPTFYRRLPKEQWDVCRARGGIAQMLVETAFHELQDCVAWFGYCGDSKAYAVDIRAGFEPTRHPRLVAKWQRFLSDAKKSAIEDKVAAIGPF